MDGNPLKQLGRLGQSVWCDEISRDFVASGRLKALMDEDGISGVTSNPTIFFRSMTTGTAYDADTARLAGEGRETSEILEALIVQDIQLAADELRAVYDKTSGKDGWVSIEVPPELAHDTQGTITQAKRLKQLVDRRNVLVKVPATEEGIPAIRDLVGQGYCINITLIFSLSRYKQVMEAYLSGLEEVLVRQRHGEKVSDVSQVHSVASFFVSRVDTLVDKRLDAVIDGHFDQTEKLRLGGLRGTAAVANATLAYEMFRSTFSGPRWQALESRGANLQRPLWASTSTKNLAYSDIMYVQELIGPQTVNTMPFVTLDAFRDHGHPQLTIDQGTDDAHRHVAEIEAAGISMEEVGRQLEDEGLKAFVDSFESLRLALEQKRSALAAGTRR
jgi:transaldolase